MKKVTTHVTCKVVIGLHIKDAFEHMSNSTWKRTSNNSSAVSALKKTPPRNSPNGAISGAGEVSENKLAIFSQNCQCCVSYIFLMEETEALRSINKLSTHVLNVRSYVKWYIYFENCHDRKAAKYTIEMCTFFLVVGANKNSCIRSLRGCSIKRFYEGENKWSRFKFICFIYYL